MHMHTVFLYTVVNKNTVQYFLSTTFLTLNLFLMNSNSSSFYTGKPIRVQKIIFFKTIEFFFEFAALVTLS